MLKSLQSSSITIEGLDVVRGNRLVVDGLTTVIAAGRLTGLLGPSGSGKTTLMRSIVGVQRIAGGTVTVLGLPAGHPQLRRRIGYRMQAASVYVDLSVRENLRYFATVLGTPVSDVERVLADVDLTTHGDDVVARLSGGEQARVSLGTALLGRPEVLVLDEPTVGLDPVLRRDLWALFHRIAATGVSVLVSSHVMDEAERCDHLLLLRDGGLVADDSPSALLHRTGARDVEGAFLALVEEAA